VTHNAHWFQGAPRLWEDDRRLPHPFVFQRLARLYEALKPDVLCLQEVSTQESVVALEKQLGMRGTFAFGGMRSEYGGAILVRRGETSFADFSCTRVDAERVFERICMRALLNLGDRSFRVVNIHLSSNRYAPGRVGAPIRMAEIQTLFAQVPDADVVMGDFNATPDSPVYQYMNDRGYVDPGYRPEDAEGEERIDYIWVREPHGPGVRDYRVVQGNGFTVGDCDPPLRLSDHCPVVAELEA
jgi:endonuclease/exonuclease/phosphatase family metal-dependent hydrolase